MSVHRKKKSQIKILPTHQLQQTMPIKSHQELSFCNIALAMQNENVDKEFVLCALPEIKLCYKINQKKSKIG